MEEAVHASVRHEKNLTLFNEAGEIAHAYDEIQEDRQRIPAKADDVAKIVSGDVRDKFNEMRATFSKNGIAIDLGNALDEQDGTFERY